MGWCSPWILFYLSHNPDKFKYLDSFDQQLWSSSEFSRDWHLRSSSGIFATFRLRGENWIVEMNCTNHVIDWEGLHIVHREVDTRTRLIKEAIHIRLHTSVMNRNEGGYSVSRIYDPVFATMTKVKVFKFIKVLTQVKWKFINKQEVTNVVSLGEKSTKCVQPLEY